MLLGHPHRDPEAFLLQFESVHVWGVESHM